MTITPESIEQLLSSEDLGERLRGVNQLREIDPATAFELIQPAIIDKNVRVRYAAVSQLASLGEQNLAKTLEMLRDRLYNDPEADVQAVAADGLGAPKLHEAFEDLKQLYHQTSEWLVKLSVVAALGTMEEPRAFEVIEDALKSNNELIQTVAISAFGEMGDAKAVSLLVPYATHPDWQIRYRVAQALVRLGGAEAETALQQLANDEVELVAQEAKVPQT